MSDLISRQQAIDVLKELTANGTNKGMVFGEDAVHRIEMLPSAQPETNCSEIPNNSDTISRQQAIDALKTDMASLDHIIKGMSAYDVRLDAYVSQRNQVDCDIDTISNLPSIQPERKTGRWIPTASGKGRHECSRCHEYAPCYQDGSEHLSTFCVLCGAKMERGEEE